MSNSELQTFLLAQFPACPLASARLAPSQDPTVLDVEVTCRAPAHVASACGYPNGRCPHRGPYWSGEEREEETNLCLIRGALGLG